MNATLTVSDNFYMTISQDAKAQEGEDITIVFDIPEEIGAYRVRFDYRNGRHRNIEYLNGRTQITLEGPATRRGFLDMQLVLDMTNGTQRKTNRVLMHVSGSIYGVTPENVILEELERLAFVEVKQELDTSEYVFYSLSGDEVGRISIQAEADIAEIHRQIEELALAVAKNTGDIEDVREQFQSYESVFQTFRDNTNNSLEYIEEKADVAQAAADSAQETANNVVDDLTAHKTSADHDSRYYTQDEVDNKIADIEFSKQYKDSVETVADLTTTYPDAEAGWVALVREEGMLYIYNGTEWVEFATNVSIVTEENDGLMTSAMLAQLNKATNTDIPTLSDRIDSEAETREDEIQSVQDQLSQQQTDIDGKAPINHAYNSGMYGYGTQSVAGHVYLADTIRDDEPDDAFSAVAASPKAVYEYGLDNISTANAYTDEQIAGLETDAQHAIVLNVAGTLAANLQAAIGKQIEVGELYNVVVTSTAASYWGAGSAQLYGQLVRSGATNVQANLWRIATNVIYYTRIVWSYQTQAPTTVVQEQSNHVAKANSFIIPDDITTKWGARPLNGSWNFMQVSSAVVALYNANASTDIPLGIYCGEIIQTNTAPYRWNAILWKQNLLDNENPVMLQLYWTETSGTSIPDYPDRITWKELGGAGSGVSEEEVAQMITDAFNTTRKSLTRSIIMSGTVNWSIMDNTTGTSVSTAMSAGEIAYVTLAAVSKSALIDFGILPDDFSHDSAMYGIIYAINVTTKIMILSNDEGEYAVIRTTDNGSAIRYSVCYVAHRFNNYEGKVVDFVKTLPEQTVTYNADGSRIILSEGAYKYNCYDGKNGTITLDTASEVGYMNGGYIIFNEKLQEFYASATPYSDVNNYVAGRMYYVGNIQSVSLNGFGEVRNVPATYQRGLAYMVSAPSIFDVSGTDVGTFTITGGASRFMESDTSAFVTKTFTGDYPYIFGDVLYYTPDGEIGVTDPIALPTACHIIGTMLTVGDNPTVSLYGAGTFIYNGTNWTVS